MTEVMQWGCEVVAGVPSTRVPDAPSNSKAGSPPAWLVALRRKHGYSAASAGAKKSGASWSKDVLAGRVVLEGVVVPEQQSDFPRNRGVLDQIQSRFGFLGFKWTAWERQDPRTGRTLRGVDYVNRPRVGGYTPTLADLLVMPVENVDGYSDCRGMEIHVQGVGKPVPVQAEAAFELMGTTGVGYKGFAGVSWRPLVEPFKLPDYFLKELESLGCALQLGFQAVQALFGEDDALTRLLTHKVPSRFPKIFEAGAVGIMRPDIVVVRDPESRLLRPVITELESCPGGQGMAHAMEYGYSLPSTMVDGYLRFLGGRQLLVYATNEWAEYTWEQACFVAELRRRGVNAWLFFDKPLSTIHDQVQPRTAGAVDGGLVQTGWWPHKDMTTAAKAVWNTDFLGRLEREGYREFVRGSDEGLPEQLDSETVVYRFGYFDNFCNTDGLDRLLSWHGQGAQVVNPLWFPLENKALMAAFWLPSVMAWIRARSPEALDVLHRCVAETHLLASGFYDYDNVVNDQQYRLTKFGAWDGKNMSWGSRSLLVGAQVKPAEWIESLRERQALPHPVVVQHLIASARFNAVWRDREGNQQIDWGARTRLTPFYLFDGSAVELVGSTMTLRNDSFRIHGAENAEEGPVVFVDEEI